MIRIKHKRKKCIGCGYCEHSDPLMWQMDNSDGKASLIGASVANNIFYIDMPDSEQAYIDRVISVCPINIITVDKLY